MKWLRNVWWLMQGRPPRVLAPSAVEGSSRAQRDAPDPDPRKSLFASPLMIEPQHR
jgi:hypothetical protein